MYVMDCQYCRDYALIAASALGWIGVRRLRFQSAVPALSLIPAPRITEGGQGSVKAFDLLPLDFVGYG